MCDTRSPINVLNVFYLTTPSSMINDARFAALAKSSWLPEITTCTSWEQLLTAVSKCCGDTLVIFDTWYLTRETISPLEITGMLCSVFKCANNPSTTKGRIKFALYSDTKCTAEEVKSLKSAEILGVIPGPVHASLARRVEIVETIAAMKPCWPKEVIVGAAKKVEVDTNGIRLTTRQSQVLSLVCNRGLSNKKIASLLKISESTVKIHVSAILKEYGVRNRTQLALAARESLHA